MKVLKNWLENWVDLTGIKDKELLSLLENLGYEIEGSVNISPSYKNVVVGTVVNIQKIPEAERIRLITVDIGSDELDIVCGAWNFKVEDRVPVAPPGSYIKTNFKIDQREIKGITSNGMICSPSELDLWDDEQGILVLSEEFANGALLENCYQSTDLLIDLSITPNRGDSMSHYGLAREISTATERNLNTIKDTYNNDIESIISVGHGKNSGSTSYFALEIENIKIKNSSLDIMFKLGSVGVRPINNIVDATNYVLFDLGQPLHAFDRDKLTGPISVRKAKNSEQITTLDSQTRNLNNKDIVIVDNKKPVALGGVMGGLDSQITEKTTNILIESANFDTINILNTSRSMNLISEASMRFERGVDNNLQELALVTFRECISKTKNNYKFSDINGSRVTTKKNSNIKFNLEYFERIIGIPINIENIERIFTGLGFVYTVDKTGIFKVTSPSWRYDIEREIDLVEELARHLNYDSFPSTVKLGNNYNVGNKWHFINTVSNILTSEGYFECSNLSFISKDHSKIFTPEREPVSLSNPLDESQQFLRTTSVTHLLNNLNTNLNIGNPSYPLFEVGVSFINEPNVVDKNIPKQINFLTLASSEKITPSDNRSDEGYFDIYHMKKTLQRIGGKDIKFEHISRPGMHSMQSYTIMSNDVNLGWFGKVSDKASSKLNLKVGTYIAEINLEKLEKINNKLNYYKTISSFPFVKFDLSFKLTNNIFAQDLLNCISNLYPVFENSSYIFDEYFDPKSNERTIGIRVKLRNHEQTIGEEELVNIRSNIIQKISEIFPAILKDNE